MRLKVTYFFVGLMTLVCHNLISQNRMNPVGGGEFVFNESKAPCLTNEQRTAVMSDIKSNIMQLQTQNRLSYNASRQGGHPLFIWPVKKKDGVEYNDVWSISGYFDHNNAYPNQLTDYNCGTKTYDTAAGYNHLGVDIFTWPFSWKMMDYEEAEIIAAAPGQILYKASSYFDRSCNFNSNPWNAVYVQHADGSVALYGHMKQNSLTTKNVGDWVETGEYLGIVGSSGNSTGPHLHFEVYSEVELNGVGQDVLIDPYTGTCNPLNVDTWWQDQKPYNNPNINAALTHSAPPVFPNCPGQETPNESNQFEPGQTIYFAAYLRDQLAGSQLTLRIVQPNGSTFETWNLPLSQNYTASYWYWSNNVFTTMGEWRWEVTYQGQTVSHTFNVGTLSVEEENLNSTNVYPNPFNDIVSINSSSKIDKATIIDMLGKQLKVISNNADGIKEIDLETLSNGIYFLNLESDSGQRKTIKIIKE